MDKSRLQDHLQQHCSIENRGLLVGVERLFERDKAVDHLSHVNSELAKLTGVVHRSKQIHQRQEFDISCNVSSFMFMFF